MFVTLRGPQFLFPCQGRAYAKQIGGLQRKTRGFTISAIKEALNMTFSPGTAELPEAGTSGALDPAAAAIATRRAGAFPDLGSSFLTRLPAAPLPAPYGVGFSPDCA